MFIIFNILNLNWFLIFFSFSSIFSLLNDGDFFSYDPYYKVDFSTFYYRVSLKTVSRRLTLQISQAFSTKRYS